MDSSGSVRRKRVSQVRAREDNQYGYRGSPGLVKMVLMHDLTRDLTNRSTACNVYCSNLLSGWDSVDISAESVDRLWISVDRLLAL